MCYFVRVACYKIDREQFLKELENMGIQAQETETFKPTLEKQGFM